MKINESFFLPGQYCTKGQGILIRKDWLIIQVFLQVNIQYSHEYKVIFAGCKHRC
jgi:hypothetical protein